LTTRCSDGEIWPRHHRRQRTKGRARDTSLEKLASLKPAFDRDRQRDRQGKFVAALNDGAAARSS